MSSPPKYEESISQHRREEGDLHDVLDESYISSKSVYEVRGESAPLAAALALDKPHVFSKHMQRLYLVCLVAYLNSCINGFDASVMTGINSIEAYLSYFHIQSLGSGTGIVFAMFSIAQLIGAFVAGPASDKWGRRVGMAIGSAIIIGGTAVQATAQQIGQFMAGRFCVGFGVSIISTAAPAYVVEMAHPAWRGAFTGGYNICWYLGSIVAAWTTYGTSRNIQSTFAWRIPVAIQAAPSVIVLAVVLFLPETPRWLVSVGRRAEARRVLSKYHANNNRHSPIVRLQMFEIDEYVLLNGSDKRWWDYSDLFSSRNARYRSFMVFTIAIFGQWSGNAIVTQWFPSFLRTAGVVESKVLFYNSLDPILCFFAALAGTFMVDRRGRRPLIFYVTFSLSILWAIIVATTAVFQESGEQNKAAANASIAIIYIFRMIYSFGYTPMQALWPVECLKFETRAKGMAMCQFFVNVAQFVNQYGLAVSLDDTHLGWKTYILFPPWIFVEALIIFFFWPETKGRTLEELDDIFSAKNPVKESLRLRKVVVGSTGEYVVQGEIQQSRKRM